LVKYETRTNFMISIHSRVLFQAVLRSDYKNCRNTYLDLNVDA